MFGRRVFGGIDWETLEEGAKLATPAAYVVITDDDAGDWLYQNEHKQDVEDNFDVCVVLSPPDERDPVKVDAVHDARRLLLLALVGWRPAAECEPIRYIGGQLLLVNRARMVYRFSFRTEWRIGRTVSSDPAETWHEREIDGLPPLEGFDIYVDAIHPMADKNQQYPGPDGRIEVTMREDLPR